MKRKPSTAPVADSPWAVSILPSTSKRSPTHAASSTPSAPDALPVQPPPPVPAPDPDPTPAWSAEPTAPIEPTLVSTAPAQFAPPPQYAPPAQFAPAQFGPPAQFAQPQFGPPAQFAPPAHLAPPVQFGPPPAEFAAPSYQTPAYPPPGFLPPGQGQPYQTFAPTSGRSTGSKVLIGLAIGVVGFVLLGILAAIAIPVFLNQRAKPANRNVVLPPTLVDQQKVSDPELDATVTAEVANMEQHIPGITETQASFYGQGGAPTLLVVAGRLPRQATPADVKLFFSAPDGAHQPGFVSVGSGPFGGSMECGPLTVNGDPFEACASIDNAAAVFVFAANTTPSQLALLTRQVLSGIEQKG